MAITFNIEICLINDSYFTSILYDLMHQLINFLQKRNKAISLRE